MDWKLPFEAAFCPLCLWGDVALLSDAMDKFKLLLYTFLIVGMCFVWKFAGPFLTFVGLKDWIGDGTNWLFSILLAGVWIAFAIERATVRQQWRKRTRRALKKGEHYATDFIAHVCCFPYAALQDAVLVEELD